MRTGPQSRELAIVATVPVVGAVVSRVHGGESITALLASPGRVIGVDVSALSGSDIGVPEARGDFLDIPSGRDQGRAVRVPQVVERRRYLDDFAIPLDALQADVLDGSREHPPADVPIIVRGPGARREHEVMRPATVRREFVLTQLRHQRRRDLDTAPRAPRLQGDADDATGSDDEDEEYFREVYAEYDRRQAENAASNGLATPEEEAEAERVMRKFGGGV